MMNQLTGAPAAEPPDPGQELLLLLLPHPLIPSCGQSQGKPASGSSARTNTSERCASHAAKPQLKLRKSASITVVAFVCMLLPLSQAVSSS